MSLLKIRKVEAEERCWSVELLDDAGVLLRSQKGVSRGEVTAIARALKAEGPTAPVLEEVKVQPGQVAWVIEKTRRGWAVRFTPVSATMFDLLLKPEAGDSPKVAVERVELIRKCLAEVEIVWDPPEDAPVCPPITIRIDNEPHEARENPMSANDILRLGGLDPDNNYLVQIEDGKRINYQGKGNELIVLYEGAEFVGHYSGPKRVSRLDR